MISILIINVIYIPLGIALHVSQPYRVEGKEEQVPLHCLFTSKLRSGEMRVSLYKGLHDQERICGAYVNLSEPYFTTDGRVHCKGNISSGRVDMFIFGLKGEDTDIYRCEIEVLFPPPYLKSVGNGTVVHIREAPNCPTALKQGQSRISEGSLAINDVGPLPLLYTILIITSCIFILQIMKIIWKWRDNGSMAPMASQKDSYRKF